MGQTRVELQHLLEDLRDAYPASLEETIVAETVANALDSGARRIAFATETERATLTIVDDGRGMTRAQLRRYHDLAATTKRRGHGIGFAGVGIKLALLACDHVVTESRHAGRSYATTWRLASRQRAPWDYVEPAGLVPGDSGTALELRLGVRNQLSPLLDPGWLVNTLVHGFAPLFDPTFDEILARAYPEGVRFSVDGRVIPRTVAAALRLLHGASVGDRLSIAIKLPRKHKPSAVGWLARADEPLPDADRGVAVSTLGKVIRRGWDWLGITPAAGDRVTGLIEAPGLAEALQLNKSDFISRGRGAAVYLAYRKAAQEAVSARLAEWGDAPPPRDAKRSRTRAIERDLEHVLVDMADDFPLLGALVERRSGGQKRIPIGRAAAKAAGGETLLGPGFAFEPAHAQPGTRGMAPGAEAPQPPGEAAPTPGGTPGAALPAVPEPPPVAGLPGRVTGRKRGRYALEIRFESRPEAEDLARLVESTVWVNDAHPAYLRASASRADGYHIALCVAMALAPLAVEPAAAHEFITAFLAHWGEAAETKKKLRKRQKTRRA